MKTPRTALAWQICLLSIQLAVAQTTPPLDPQAVDSHRAFLNEFTNVTGQAYQQIVQRYAEAAARPEASSQTLIEQYLFIVEAFLVGEEYDHPRQSELEEILRLLESRFPDDPESVLFRASRLHGQERVQLLNRSMANNRNQWSRQQHARRWELLAWAKYNAEDLAGAFHDARMAMALDPSRDLTLIVASYFDWQDASQSVIETLTGQLDTEAEAWQRQRKAQLLAKAGDHDRALKIYDDMVHQEGAYVNPVDYAKSLEAAGRHAEARDQLVKATELAWARDESSFRLFDFDLKHGEAADALESYRAWTGDDFEVDLLLRHRLSLLWKYPTAAWSLEDGIRLFLLLLAGGILLCVPLGWILPVHHFGLWRRSRRSIASQRDLHWNLWHLWAGSAFWLTASAAAIYFWQYDSLSAFLTDDEVLEWTLDPTSLAPTTLTFAAIFCAGVLLLQRKRHWSLLVTSRWSLLKGFALAALFVLALRSISLTLGHLFRAEAVLLWPVLDTNYLALSTRGQAFLAFGVRYGPIALFLWGVLIQPIAEEFLFRGVVLDSVERHFWPRVANLMQAVAFALIHQEVSLLPYFLCFGWLAGVLRVQTGGLLVPVIFHVLNNLLAFAPLVARLGSGNLVS